MFGLFKKKLKDVVDKFSKKTEEEVKEEKPSEEIVEEIKEEVKEEKKPKKFLGLFKIKEKEELPEEIKEEKIEEISEEKIIESKVEEKKESEHKKIIEKTKVKEEKVVQTELKEEPKEEKKGFFEKIKNIGKIKISNEKFEKLFEDLEMILLENNVAYEVIDKIKEDLKVDLVEVSITNIKKTIETSLRNSLDAVLSFEKIDLLNKVKEKKPYIILLLGVNGAGKTTTIAKLCNLFMKHNLKCVLVAADTFRAASIQQLEEHGKRLGVNVIKHDYGADPSAVAFDGIKHAEAKGIDVVLIDTAGRQHSNTN